MTHRAAGFLRKLAKDNDTANRFQNRTPWVRDPLGPGGRASAGRTGANPPAQAWYRP